MKEDTENVCWLDRDEAMKLEEIRRKYDLWSLLVETAMSIPTYNNHKAYVRDILLHEKPDVTPEELSAYIGVSLGEALVILQELKENQAS